MRYVATTRIVVSVSFALVATGCTRERERAGADGGRYLDAGRRVDAGPHADAGPVGDPDAACPTAIDLLFMVDDSNSMSEEQASLARDFPRFIRPLAAGDFDGDGVPELPPARDLHIGVVSSDLGNGGYPVPTCTSTFGDDGVLLTRPPASVMGCEFDHPSFLDFPTPPADSTAGGLFDCLARLGTSGCGFEQPLDAVLKAVTPETSPITFAMGTRGHADRENAGFLRPDSLLVIVVVTDEEDCSVSDPAVFDPSSSTYTGDLNLRCFNYPSVAHPIARYVDGLRAVRATDPDLLMFAALTGVPPDLAGLLEVVEGEQDYEAILAHPRMQEEVDGTLPRLRPSCNVPGRGLAFPPRRIVSLAQQLAPNSAVYSICQDYYAPAFHNLARRIGAVLARRC